MKNKTSNVKDLAKNVIRVPIVVGRAVLSAPKTLIKLPRMIDALEKDQGVADKLEFINQEIVEDQKRKEIVRVSKSKGMEEIITHLESYLRDHPNGCYEDWISALHPDNMTENGNIDHRFYVEDSDHRLLWNEYMKEELDSIERIVDSRITHTHNHHVVPEKKHLQDYLKAHGNACYEDWVLHLYPSHVDFSNGRISHQFYVEDSDHRHLWNDYMQEIDCVERIVESRDFPAMVDHSHPQENSMLR